MTVRFIRSIFSLSKMALLDQNGKIFGIVSIIDATIFLFFLAVITTVLVYLYAPPLVHQQEEVFFQIYFVSDEYSQPFPYAMVQTIFIPGTELVSPQGSHLTITNVTFTSISLPSSNVNFLVTLNGTLEKGSDGQYLFDGYQIAPGKMILLEINHSYFAGTVQRVNYTNYEAVKNVSLQLISRPNGEPLVAGESIYNAFGKEEGKVISINHDSSKISLALSVDVYDDIVVFQEYPLHKNYQLFFTTIHGNYLGYIINIEEEDTP